MKKKDNSDIVKEQIDTMQESKFFDAENDYKNTIEDLLAELKAICIRAKIPMFISLAIKNTENETVYVNDCVLASLEQSSRGKRIGKLLLTLNNAELNLPEHIKRDMEELQQYYDRMSRSQITDPVLGKELTDDKIRDYLEVAEGLVTVSPPKTLFGDQYSDVDFDDLDDALQDY